MSAHTPAKASISGLYEKANAILISTDEITEESANVTIEQLEAYPHTVHALFRHTLTAVLRERFRLSDIFLNPPLTGFSEDISELIGEGVFGKVYKTKYQDEDVAVKVLRQEAGTNPGLVKPFLHEIQSWKKMNKSSYIAPFYGCSARVNKNPRFVFMLVSPLADYSLREYPIDEKPHHVTCKLIIDVAKGLCDLHNMGYIHGDIHLDNILVFGRVAKLADFGLMKLVDTDSSFSLAGQHVNLHPGRVCPGVIAGNFRCSFKSDIFSFGRLVYELFDPDHVMFRWPKHIEHPPKPQQMMDASWDGLWEVLLECWQNDPDARPTAADIVSQLDNIFNKLGENHILDLCDKANAILASTNEITEESVDKVIKQLKAYPPNLHPSFCDSLTTVLHKRYHLSDIFLNPPLTDFPKDDSEFIGEGSFGKVYKTKYQGEYVAVKVLWPEISISDYIQLFLQEARLWREVSNYSSRYITPFYGCSVRINKNPCLVFMLVSPLADYGLREYPIGKKPRHVICKLIIDIAKGLRHLHELGYTHGNVHLDNVLVFNGVAKLADYGLMKVTNAVSAFSLAGTHARLHPGRVSPEILKGNLGGCSAAADIFSYGRLVYELFDPDHLMFRQPKYIEHPSKPQQMIGSSWDGLWKLLLMCWQKMPDERCEYEDGCGLVVGW